jgi:hypothetical protein
MFGSKWEDVEGGWGGPRNEELHDLYCSPNTIRVRAAVGGSCDTYGGEKKWILVFGGQS